MLWTASKSVLLLSYMKPMLAIMLVIVTSLMLVVSVSISNCCKTASKSFSKRCINKSEELFWKGLVPAACELCETAVSCACGFFLVERTSRPYLFRRLASETSCSTTSPCRLLSNI